MATLDTDTLISRLASNRRDREIAAEFDLPEASVHRMVSDLAARHGILTKAELCARAALGMLQ